MYFTNHYSLETPLMAISITFLHVFRDTNAGDKMNPFAEQEAWEEHQIGISWLICWNFETRHSVSELSN